MRRSIILALSAGVAAAAVGGWSFSVSRADAERSAMAADDTGELPGVRTDRYLGRHVGPTFWADELSALDQAVTSCIEEGGFTPVEVDQIAERSVSQLAPFELQATDRDAFHSAYGYGIAPQIEYGMSLDALSRAQADDRVLPPPGYDRLARRCSDEAYREIIEPLLPAPEIHQSYNALYLEYLNDPARGAATSLWRDCMIEAGVPAETSGSEVVTARAFELAGVPEIGEEGTVRMLALNPGDLASLQSFEVDVYNADAACQQSSGLRAVEYDIETKILEQMQSRYPNFSGVVAAGSTTPASDEGSTAALVTEIEAEHVVQSGESVSAIASLYGISVTDLCEANAWSDCANHLLLPGDVVTIPAGASLPVDSDGIPLCPDGTERSHVELSSGDTPAAVAQQLGVTLPDLDQANVLNPAYEAFNVGAVVWAPCPSA